MGTRAIELGPAGHTVAKQIRRIRELDGLSLQELSERLEKIGRPIVPSGLSKIELGNRRVDVDDLVALAAALRTTPNDLLYGPGAAPAGISQEDYERVAAMIVRATITAEGRVTEGRVTDSAGLTDAATLDLQQDTDR
jgi:transcriptional regulator with XRE-family HTH domain